MKNKIITFSFVFVIFGFFILNLLIPDQTISWSERRSKQTFPKIKWNQIQDKRFMTNFDNYALDQFVFRDNFRSLKANIMFNILGKLDNNKIYVKDNNIFKSEYPTNEDSINKFIEKIKKINEKYLQNNKVYYSIIPDKNYYLNDDKYLNINYDALYKKVINSIDLKYIDLRNVLSLDDYYRTDTHWKQENLQKVVDTLGKEMNFEVDTKYEIKSYYPFYGVYYGQSALKIKPDTIKYLTNEEIEKTVVHNYEKEHIIYNISKLGTIDSYDVFLSGATPLVTLYNPAQKNGRELIIFRDSFASSLTPLLINAYSKITLIDLRYMTTKIMEENVVFKDQDVLFLYSTLIINNSSSLKD